MTQTFLISYKKTIPPVYWFSLETKVAKFCIEKEVYIWKKIIFQNSEFQYYNSDRSNSYVKQGKLYIKPVSEAFSKNQILDERI